MANEAKDIAKRIARLVAATKTVGDAALLVAKVKELEVRSVFQRVIRGRVMFTPWADWLGSDFSAETRFDRLFTGVAFVPFERPSWIPEGDVRNDAHYSSRHRRGS